MPEFDREGGSRLIFHRIEFFKRAGWAVSFIAENAIGGERYAHTLQQMGVATYVSRNPWDADGAALISPEQLIGAGQFDLILIAFWHVAESYIPLIRSLSPKTILVVDSIDLHFLRQSRRVFCARPENGAQGALDVEYAHEMMRELNVYASADAVLTVSQKEADLINDFVGASSLAQALPDNEDAADSPVPFAGRKGMLFVGNFRHPPNVQAVEYLCRDILPRLNPEVLDAHPLYIVGNALTETVLQCCNEVKNVRPVGWVPSVLPYLQQVRVSLIPLLYGAGTKTKLTQSLMIGTPSVSTSIGVEGLDLQDNLDVLVADDPATFAAAIERMVEDEELWQRLASHGHRTIVTRHGREAVFSRFNFVINEIMSQKNICLNSGNKAPSERDPHFLPTHFTDVEEVLG